LHLQQKGEKMKSLILAMKGSPLFQGIEEKKLLQLAGTMQEQSYKKEEFVLHQGDVAKGIGLVTEGRLHIIREDFLGNREILAEVEWGEIFGEVYGILTEEPQRVAVSAAADSRVVFFSVERLLESGGPGSEMSQRLLQNLLRVVARKNLLLTMKMSHLSRRSIREKVISYLSEEAGSQGSSRIKIPFNRQQLADYLAVERSALSRELSRMRREGLIECQRNYFELKAVRLK